MRSSEPLSVSVSAFGLEPEADEDDMQISDDQSVNVRQLIGRQSLGMDLTLGGMSSFNASPLHHSNFLSSTGDVSSSHTRRFLGNIVGHSREMQLTKASNMTANMTTEGRSNFFSTSVHTNYASAIF